MGKKYRAVSWIDSRIEIRPSPIHGLGSFTRDLIRPGEAVTIWGGRLFTKAEIALGKARPGSAAAISEELFLANPAEDPDRPDQFLNHSCDPNLWMRDEVTLVARRAVLPGEELTADYAFWEGDEERVLPWQCRCGSPLCRRTVTGRDFRLPELQIRYGGHFSPFLNARLRKKA